jgi:hypothetical protein
VQTDLAFAETFTHAPEQHGATERVDRALRRRVVERVRHAASAGTLAHARGALAASQLPVDLALASGADG